MKLMVKEMSESTKGIGGMVYKEDFVFAVYREVWIQLL